MVPFKIPATQTVALVRSQGGPIEFVSDYPVPIPGQDEILAKVLYSGVCQSDLHTARGTASGPDGKPITDIKLPHIGGHEGVGRIVAIGPGLGERDPTIQLGDLVGIRFSSRVCRRCEFCLQGREQYCCGGGARNHLHHEDGSFQEYIALDANYLTLLPPDTDPITAAPTLCAGLTAYKALLNASIRPNDHLLVIGAGGGLGQYATQYGLVAGCRVLGIDSGPEKERLVKSFGAHFLDFKSFTSENLITQVQNLTDGKGAHAAIVAAGSSAAFAQAASMLRVGGTLCLIGIPPGGGRIETPVSEIVIKGLTIRGNLVGNLGECMEALELVRAGRGRPRVFVREFRELGTVYEEMEKGEVAGRVVLKAGEDPGPKLNWRTGDGPGHEREPGTRSKL